MTRAQTLPDALIVDPVAGLLLFLFKASLGLSEARRLLSGVGPVVLIAMLICNRSSRSRNRSVKLVAHWVRARWCSSR